MTNLEDHGIRQDEKVIYLDFESHLGTLIEDMERMRQRMMDVFLLPVAVVEATIRMTES